MMAANHTDCVIDQQSETMTNISSRPESIVRADVDVTVTSNGSQVHIITVSNETDIPQHFTECTEKQRIQQYENESQENSEFQPSAAQGDGGKTVLVLADEVKQDAHVKVKNETICESHPSVMHTNDETLEQLEEPKDMSSSCSETAEYTDNSPQSSKAQAETRSSPFFADEVKLNYHLPMTENGVNQSADDADIRTAAEACFINQCDFWTYMRAAETGDTFTLLNFLDEGLPVDIICSQSDNHLLLNSNRGETAFVRACCVRQMGVAKLLLERGADINIRSETQMKETALHVAVARYSLENVRFLLAYGANPNIPNSRGQTPLMIAVCQNHVEMVCLLLEYGSDIRQSDAEGKSVLHYCFDCSLANQTKISSDKFQSSVQCAKLLTRAGADLDAFDSDYQTPLVLAITHGNIQGAKFLLMQNCDPDLPASALQRAANCPKSSLRNPFMMSVLMMNMDMIKSLLKAGCKFEDISDMTERLPTKFIFRVQSLVIKPRSLMETCRIVLRRALRECGGVGPRLFEKVDSLPVPEALKNFILLKDIKAEACSVT